MTPPKCTNFNLNCRNETDGTDPLCKWCRELADKPAPKDCGERYEVRTYHIDAFRKYIWDKVLDCFVGRGPNPSYGGEDKRSMAEIVAEWNKRENERTAAFIEQGRQEAQPTWQPISTAPKNGDSILLGEADHMNIVVSFVCAVGWWAHGRWTLVGDTNFTEICLLHPTCWMPLPTPPTESGGE